MMSPCSLCRQRPRRGLRWLPRMYRIPRFPASLDEQASFACDVELHRADRRVASIGSVIRP